MQDDLLDAQASIDWANAQLPILQKRILDWTAGRPYVIARHIDPQTGEHVLQFEEREPVPRAINAETGVIINSIRSSLDILANTLAKRNGDIAPKDVSFPICRSAASFTTGKHAGRKMIKRLSLIDQKIIEDLKPYQGGDDLLFTLHDLDVERKHRNLLAVKPVPKAIGIPLKAQEPKLAIHYRGGPLKHGAILARSAHRFGDELHLSIEITLNEAHALTRYPVIAALNRLASRAEEIVKLFDT